MSSVIKLIAFLQHKTTAVRSDAIKVLYEIASRKIDLVLPYTKEMLALLNHKDNRLKWGTMTILSTISNSYPQKLAERLPAILEAMDAGSVITRDHGSGFYAQLLP